MMLWHWVIFVAFSWLLWHTMQQCNNALPIEYQSSIKQFRYNAMLFCLSSQVVGGLNDLAQLVTEAMIVEGWQQCGLPPPKCVCPDWMFCEIGEIKESAQA